MNVTIVMPSYKPERSIVGHVDDLASRGFERIVVVDDGSGDTYRGIFDELRAKPFCTVLSHEVNRGKGVALKTGLSFVLEHQNGSMGVVTADSDGQHSTDDCVRMAKALLADADTVFIGSREFSLGKIPFRSWIGNRWSSATFALVLGRWLPDTQTGLRAFPIATLPMLVSVAGERYEYEMGVLMKLARSNVPIRPLSISTIYENGNACSHFNPLKDTIRINRLVLGDFVRFAGVSIMSFMLDQLLAWGFAVALTMMGCSMAGIVWASGFAARLISSMFNFTLNRSFVFRSGCGVGTAAWKYALLCVAVIVLSNIGVMALSFICVPRGIAKFVCDVFLCFVGYSVQSKFIFRR